MVAKDLSGLVIDDHVPLFAVPPCLVGACWLLPAAPREWV